MLAVSLPKPAGVNMVLGRWKYVPQSKGAGNMPRRVREGKHCIG